MITLRRSEDRGHADHGWLVARHTFSFAGYRDPRWRGYRSLRVMNEDRIAPGQGFGTHPHRDMEIVTLVLSGALEHRDSMGNGEVLRPGELQRMTAGTGVTHSEFNPSADEPTHLYQVWLLPAEKGLTPGYEQRAFDPAERLNRLRLVASPDGAEGSLTLHQDARVYLATLEPGHEARHTIAPGRGAWLQVIKGAVRIGDLSLRAGDGAAVEDEERLTVVASEGAEVMLFDLG